jgi:hypothetical protein
VKLLKEVSIDVEGTDLDIPAFRDMVGRRTSNGDYEGVVRKVVCKSGGSGIL